MKLADWSLAATADNSFPQVRSDVQIIEYCGCTLSGNCEFNTQTGLIGDIFCAEYRGRL